MATSTIPVQDKIEQISFTLSTTGAQYFTTEYNMCEWDGRNLHCYLRLHAIASVPVNTEIMIGTLSNVTLGLTYPGTVASASNSSMLGSFVVTSSGAVYINLFGTVTNGNNILLSGEMRKKH